MITSERGDITHCGKVMTWHDCMKHSPAECFVIRCDFCGFEQSDCYEREHKP